METNMKMIILYQSKYGSSRQYAVWLAEELKCTIRNIRKITVENLVSYDKIIYIGGLYAGKVNGFDKLKKYLPALQSKKVLLCMVGLTNPRQEERYRQVFCSNVPEQYRRLVKPFALRGDLLFSKMSIVHRLMMKVPKAMAEKIPEEERTEDDWELIRSYGQDIRFTAKENLLEIINYLKSM